MLSRRGEHGVDHRRLAAKIQCVTAAQRAPQTHHLVVHRQYPPDEISLGQRAESLVGGASVIGWFQGRDTLIDFA